MRVTVVRADYGRHTEASERNGYVGIGWFDPPLPDERDRASVRALYEARFADQNENHVSQNAGQVYRFLDEIRPGDLVVTPYSDGPLLLGRATGEPYAGHDDTSPYGYRIPVDWTPEPLDRYALSIQLQNTLKSSLTVFNEKQVADVCEADGVEYDGAEEAEAAPKKPAVRERADLYEAAPETPTTSSRST